ncbi:MAG: CPBP family intramembrane metalloprotease [Candidatus Heimdallarchaeota archaeon]|nr:CPBP family intramembrane metalloprotease [Candidatus Heimdallarchaeota archaeon]
MHKKRLAFDSLFIFLSISLFSVIRVIFERSLPINELNQGSILPGFSITYSIFLYIGIIIIFLLYGWTLRRWFLKKELEKNDYTLKHIYVIFIVVFLIIIVNFITIYLLPLAPTNFYVQFTTAVFEILQLVAISTTFGILLYPQIEEKLGLLLFKEILQADETKLGLGSVQKQVRFYSKKYWKILMVVMGLVIIFSNLLLFIIYPSIPVAANEGLNIFYPNFGYTYDPSTGFRQKFFDYTTIPSSVLVDWKLVQSIMSLIILAFIALIIYLPSKPESKPKSEVKEIKESPKDESSQENIAYNVLSPSVELKDYSPSHQINSKSERRASKIFSKALESDLIGVMGLLCFNFALSMLIIFIFQNMGIITTISLQLDELYDNLYINLSNLFWAGFAEEMIFRWLIFGLPLFVIYGIIYLILRIIKFKSQQKSIKQESKKPPRFLEKIKTTNPLLYLIGGWKRVDFIGIIFLIFSSFAFGYVHYANGWGAWKIFQAGVAGAVFGYAYIKYGFHAAIFLHAANNFIIGYLITPNYGLIINGQFMFLVLTFLGAFILLNFTMIVLSKFFKGMNILFGRYNKELS